MGGKMCPQHLLMRKDPIHPGNNMAWIARVRYNYSGLFC
jgi:hypothetical protein